MMERYRKVIWAEGTMLAQQHFQCWDKQLQAEHWLDRQFFREDNWGIAELGIHENLLAQGQFKIQKATIRFPDQRWFYYQPNHDEPLVRALPDGGPEKLIVCLGLELSEEVSGISGYEQTSRKMSCWQADYEPVADIYDNQRHREVLLAELRPALYWQHECPDNVTLVPVAALIFNHQSNSYCLDKHFIPPVLRLAAAESLQDAIHSTVIHIDASIARISSMKNKQVSDNKEAFILLSLSGILCRLRASLMVLQQAANAGPFQLYQCWTLCLAELAAFLDDPLTEPPLPYYQHQNLTQTFFNLQREFEAMMQRVIPADTASIPLFQQANGSWVSDKISVDELRNKQFCLAVNIEDADEEILEKIQQQIKISSPEKLHLIVHSFSTGVSLSRLKSVNGYFPAKRHYHYFQICQQDKGWQEILEEQKIAFFAGSALAAAKIELLVY